MDADGESDQEDDAAEGEEEAMTTRGLREPPSAPGPGRLQRGRHDPRGGFGRRHRLRVVAARAVVTPVPGPGRSMATVVPPPRSGSRPLHARTVALSRRALPRATLGLLRPVDPA